MEYDQIIIIRFLCKERVSSQDIHARLEVQFGDATDSEQSVRRCCRYVRKGRDDLRDEVGSGSPPIDFLDILTPALLDQQPFHSVYSIAEVLGVSHSTFFSYLWESPGMKIFHFRWIPHELTTSLRRIRMETCRDISHSQGSRKKYFLKICDSGTKVDSFWNFIVL
jgi:hypothetical protein